MPSVADRPSSRSGAATRAGAGLLAGALLAGSLPPFGWWPLGLAGAALLAAACRGARAPVRALVGLVAGAAQLAVGLAFTAAFTLVGAVVLVAAESALFALACALAPPGPGATAGLAGLLTLAEAARDRWPFGGLPLGGAALGQADGPLLRLARLGGPVAVTLAVYLAGAGLAALATRPRRAGGPAALAAVVALAGAATVAPAGGPDLGRLRVALVQGGGPRGFGPTASLPAAVVYAHTLRVAGRVAPGTARLVVLPEDVVPLDRPLAGSTAGRALGNLAHHLGATLLAGVTTPAGPARFRNELVAWGPSGRLVGRFEKVHRVPFGEYVPWRGLLGHLVSLSAVPRDAVPGHGTGALATPAGHLALLVSFEDFFTGRGRSGVRAGGRLLVLATNTASYATTQVPSQELAASRLQAVATGRYLVQAATTGYSALVTPGGAVKARSSLGRPALTLVTARLRAGRTPYDVAGSSPFLGLALALALAGLASARLARSRRRSARPGPARSRRRPHRPGGRRSPQPSPTAGTSPVASAPPVLAPPALALPALALPAMALPGIALPALALPAMALPGTALPATASGASPGASPGGLANRNRLNSTNLPTHRTP